MKIKLSIFLSFVLGASLNLAHAAPASQAVKGIASVNGVTIPAEQLDLLVTQAEMEGAQITPEVRQQLREKLINRQVVLQEAKRLGIDKKADVRIRSQFASEDIVINDVAAEALAKNPVNEADINAAYKELSASISGNEYRLHHALYSTEAEAKSALVRLSNGEKFEDVARATSVDLNSANQGGEIGWIRESEYRPEILSVLRTLKPGQTTSAPIKSPSGWHVMRLDEVRVATVPPLAQIQTQLQQAVAQRKFVKYQESLRASVKVQ